MLELREDVTTKEWVVLAPERGGRTHDLRAVASREPVCHRNEECPFCPGNEASTPPELDRLMLPSQRAHGWQVRIVPNRLPAFKPDAGAAKPTQGTQFRSMPALGAHEVVIESPDHHLGIADMTAAEVVCIFSAYQRRYRVLRRMPGVQSIVIFKNHGRAAGTSLVHPHSQIIALPVATPLAQRKYEIARRHFREGGTCLYCDLREWERSAQERVVFEAGSVVAIHPYASRSPFETWILPLAHRPSFGSIEESELKDAASATQRVLRGLRDALDDPPFNYVIHTAPVVEEDRPYFLWHIQIVPRLAIAAGFELGSGIPINVSMPEETAKFMRTQAL